MEMRRRAARVPRISYIADHTRLVYQLAKRSIRPMGIQMRVVIAAPACTKHEHDIPSQIVRACTHHVSDRNRVDGRTSLCEKILAFVRALALARLFPCVRNVSDAKAFN